MKIITILRTYNEELFLKKFVDAYSWVDRILVQDDWSDDIDYLFQFPKRVLVSFFTGERIERDEITRAKQDVQLNGLIRWAEQMDADWIIMDDCDSVPNPKLIRDAREIIERCDKDFIYAPRMYLYKDQGWFPKMSIYNKVWESGIWAWRARKGFRFIDNGDGPQRFERPSNDDILRLDAPPYVLLHQPWMTDEIIAEKRYRYTQIYGDEYENFNPLNFAGEIKPLPEWVNEHD